MRTSEVGALGLKPAKLEVTSNMGVLDKWHLKFEEFEKSHFYKRLNKLTGKK